MDLSKYDEQAEKFLANFGLTFRAEYLDTAAPPWGAEVHGDRYRVTLRRTDRTARPGRISFPYWGSASDAQAGRSPTPYDVLACLSSDIACPDTFEDFCYDFGYDEDSRAAEATYRSVARFAARLRAFFSDEAEREALSEIQ